MDWNLLLVIYGLSCATFSVIVGFGLGLACWNKYQLEQQKNMQAPSN